MRSLFDYADKFNKEREPLTLAPHWIPGFVIVLIAMVKWFLKFFLYVILVFLPFCFTVTGVASGSMTPTCQTNEWVLASKLGYGISIAKFLQLQTQNESFLDKIIWRYDEPKLGDVISLQVPSVDHESIYTKRICGVEGDSVQFKNGILFINDQPVKLIFKRNYTYIENNEEITGQLYEETFPNGNKHFVLYVGTPGIGSLDNTEKFIIPKGCVFACGDNRHRSDDGRSLFAFVEKRHIQGKVVMILFSNGNLTSLNLKNFIKGMRWDRCLKWMI